MLVIFKGHSISGVRDNLLLKMIKQTFKEAQIRMAKWPVEGNQYKLVFTFFTIGYSGQWGTMA